MRNLLSKKTLVLGLILLLSVSSIFILKKFLEFRSTSGIGSGSEYTLTIVSNPGDRVDLYEYKENNLSHQGKEIFYLKEVGKDGKLEIALPSGRYTIFARCLKMDDRRSFEGPNVVTLDKNKTVKLQWKPQI